MSLHSPRRINFVLTGLVVIFAGEAAQGQLTPRTPLPKRPYVVLEAPHRMVVKFKDAMQARCQQGQLQAGTSSQQQQMLSTAQTVVNAYNLLFTKLIDMPYAQLRQLEQRAEARSGDAQADLGGMMVVHHPGRSCPWPMRSTI